MLNGPKGNGLNWTLEHVTIPNEIIGMNRKRNNFKR